jgi:hypothetical protein
MKKIMSLFCVMLIASISIPVFAAGKTEVITDYEPWKYMMMAGMGSCSECDPGYTFQYNHQLREKERKAGEAYTYSQGSSDGIFKDMSMTDLLMIGALTAAGTFILFSILFEKPEFVKISF